MRQHSRTDLCGGRPETVVPTATPAWETARTTLPGILAERSHSDPPQLRSGG